MFEHGLVMNLARRRIADNLGKVFVRNPRVDIRDSSDHQGNRFRPMPVDLPCATRIMLVQLENIVRSVGLEHGLGTGLERAGDASSRPPVLGNLLCIFRLAYLLTLSGGATNSSYCVRDGLRASLIAIVGLFYRRIRSAGKHGLHLRGHWRASFCRSGSLIWTRMVGCGGGVFVATARVLAREQSIRSSSSQRSALQLTRVVVRTDAELQEASHELWSLSAEDGSVTHNFLELPSGTQLHYLTPKQSPDKSDALVIFLHGFPDSAHLFTRQLRSPFARAAQLVALDLPGCGGSDSLVSYGPDQVLNTVAEAIVQLKRRYSHPSSSKRQCILVGHDWGAVIGFRIVAETEGLVDRLVTLNSLWVSLRQC